MFARAWKRWRRVMVGGTLALGLGLGAGGPIRAQEPAGQSASIQELQRRLEALEKQNQMLMQMIQQQQQQQPVSVEQPAASGAGAVAPATGKEDVEKIVKEALKKDADEKKKKEDEAKKQKEEEGFVVGADLGMKAKWDHGLWLETEDKAFRFHAGGRTQYDTVFYQAGDFVQFGNNGTGRIDDSMAFRRARFAMEGTLWEVINFNMEYDFLNTETDAQTLQTNAAGVATGVNRRVQDVPVPTDLWVEVKGGEYLPNLRVGNLKPPISFEHLTSSRFLNFMERSYAFDMYIGGPDNGFQPGLMVYNNYFDDRVHLAASLTRFNQTVYGFNTGDGELALAARAGFFPVWEHDGRCAVWVGCGYRHADPDFIAQNNRQFARETLGQYRIRARTELRNGPAELHTPLLDTFSFGDSADLLVPEFAAVFGPWTFQAEYFGNWLHGTRATATGPNLGTTFSQAAYAEVLYFLTGEHRAFTKKFPNFGRVVPHENFWLVRDGCDRFNSGLGAWQVGARYSWGQNHDTDGGRALGGNNMQGSVQAVTLGLSWFLNPNLKLQWNYTHEMRYNINRVTGANAGLFPQASSDGSLNGFGMRMAFDW